MNKKYLDFPCAGVLRFLIGSFEIYHSCWFYWWLVKSCGFKPSNTIHLTSLTPNSSLGVCVCVFPQCLLGLVGSIRRFCHWEISLRKTPTDVLSQYLTMAWEGGQAQKTQITYIYIYSFEDAPPLGCPRKLEKG